MWNLAVGTVNRVALFLRQWAEDDDPAHAAAREAWNRIDNLLIGIAALIAVASLLVAAVLVLKNRAVHLKRRLIASGILVVCFALFLRVTTKMGIVWLIADPKEAGGPAIGSGEYLIWCLWLFGSTLLALASLVAAFIIVGDEDL